VREVTKEAMRSLFLFGVLSLLAIGGFSAPTGLPIFLLLLEPFSVRAGEGKTF